jgi:hypothetical protein
MVKWDTVKIMDDEGARVNAQAPVIISASRATDIPAFYSRWFTSRLEKGYVMWRNPFNGVPLNVSFEKTRLIVFWSKNPLPMLKKVNGRGESSLDVVERLGFNYYFQFTLNDYDHEKIEPNVPSVKTRIKTFVELVKRIGDSKNGVDRVIWRFDPLILTDSISPKHLLERIERIGNQIAPYTKRLVFSFVDINAYNKVARNLAQSGIKAREFEIDEMHEVAEGIKKLVFDWNITPATCGEDVILPGIEPNRCIDDRLMVKCFSNDIALMRFIGAKKIEPSLFNQSAYWEASGKHKKDPGQRAACQCIMSKDIGIYNSCPHLCQYCYANSNQVVVINNWEKHQANPGLDRIF